MGRYSFAEDFKRYGPQAPLAEPIRLREANRYCRRLARSHYENFPVVSWFVPRRLRQHFYNIYAYCRWADNLADLAPDPQHALVWLSWWESHLRACFQQRAIHPVFIALQETIREFGIPPDPFVDLLVAFRQDQQVTRYDTFDQLLAYCRYSANPVGRLVLYVAGCHDPQRAALADCICTGLQLANFWQDVAEDWKRGRIYLPLAHLRRFGADETPIIRGVATEAFRRALAAACDEAEGWLLRGRPLIGLVPSFLRMEVALFIEGGLAILQSIRQQHYDVLRQRPILSRWQKLALVLRTWWKIRIRRRMGSPEEFRC
ncbi:MAG: squalene synthase HpnC [Thermoguttaceae bacterium]|nr:squalene synthase HpnC [Thermoguttaceae bacterium]MDW8039004.1 squalene synthase HpnC [Thermoguttaceae bacterium]